MTATTGTPDFPKLKQLDFESHDHRLFTRWAHANGTTIDVRPVPKGQPGPRSQFDWRYQWTLTAPPRDGGHLGCHISGYGEMRLFGHLQVLGMIDFERYVTLRRRYAKRFSAAARINQPAGAPP
jgi:hypothetical protein